MTRDGGGRWCGVRPFFGIRINYPTPKLKTPHGRQPPRLRRPGFPFVHTVFHGRAGSALTHELDGLARHLAHTQRRAAATVSIHLGQDGAWKKGGGLHS